MNFGTILHNIYSIWSFLFGIWLFIYCIWVINSLIKFVIKFISRCWKKKRDGVPADVGGEPGFTVRSIEFDSPPVPSFWKHPVAWLCEDDTEIPQNWQYVKSIPDIISRRFGCWDRADRLFLGTREVISREVEWGPDGRSFEKLHLGDYKWLTYRQVYQAAVDFSRGMAYLEIQRERVAIFTDTRPECFIALHGCFMSEVTVVILYASLGEEALCHSLNETEVRTVICGSKELRKLVNVRGQLELVKRVICMDDDIPLDVFSALHGWTIISFGDFKKVGAKHLSGQHWCTPEEVAVIMYTGGSTGLPKAVVMTHADIFATVYSLAKIVPELGKDDVYLAYLPIADVFELVVEHVIAAVGGAIGYGSPLTLTDTSIKIKKGTKGDATILMPTLMPALPAILDRVCDGALKKVNAKAGLSKKLFDLAYERRLQAINGSWFGAWGLEKLLWNFLVFRKVRAILGGRIRYVLSSGTPLSADTHRFINICLSATVGQGYGLTETCAGGTFSEYGDATVSRVGPPLPCSYIKLINWPEGGYSTSDSPMPCGEIVIGGTNVALEYFKNEEKTSECYKVDERGMRWFYTGDIGRFHADGCLEIIDRKENIVKLQHGERVSLGKVEAALIASPFVDNIMLHADPFHSYCVALVVVSYPVLEEWTSTQGIAYYDSAELYNKEVVVEEVYVSLVKEAKKACLEEFEIPAKIKLLSGPWTPETGLVTAGLKIKRESIRMAFQEELSKLYAS